MPLGTKDPPANQQQFQAKHKFSQTYGKAVFNDSKTYYYRATEIQNLFRFGLRSILLVKEVATRFLFYLC
jgi:hypothetical protein